MKNHLSMLLLLGMIAFTVAQDGALINREDIEESAIRIINDEQAEAYIKFKFCSVCQNGGERSEVGKCQCPEGVSGSCCDLVNGVRRTVEEKEPWGGEEDETEGGQNEKEALPRNRWFSWSSAAAGAGAVLLLGR